jgi:hypothetical protein
MKVGLSSATVLRASLNAPFNDPVSGNFAIPFAAAALLVAMLVDTQFAFLTGIITALFAGISHRVACPRRSTRWFRVSAAVYGIGRYRERQSVTLAGLLLGHQRHDGYGSNRLCRAASHLNTILLGIGVALQADY